VPFQAAFPPLALPHTGRASLPPHRAGSAPPSANAPPARVKNRAKYLALGGERDSTPTRRESALLPRAWRTTLPCAMRACIPARKRAGLALVERSRPNRERPSCAGGESDRPARVERSSRSRSYAAAPPQCPHARLARRELHLFARGVVLSPHAGVMLSPRARVMLSPLGRVALP
jgi:hypothetical protein